MDREPEPWQTNAPRAFLSVGDASVQSLGGDRFLVAGPDGERTVEGFEPARQLAHTLARPIYYPSCSIAAAPVCSETCRY